jgi:phosphonoacetate hydrolase
LYPRKNPDPDWERRLGTAPPIYSREINYWLFQAALDILRNRPEIGLLYIHPTDYPMHMWLPEAAESREHLTRVDELLADLAATAPNEAILVTVDHGMNEFQIAGLGPGKGVAGARPTGSHSPGYGRNRFHLRRPQDEVLVTSLLGQLEGIERVLTPARAANYFNLMESRVGDIVVVGDLDTVFGNLSIRPWRPYAAIFEPTVAA